MHSIQHLIDYVTKVGEKVIAQLPTVNRGGCGAYALLLHRLLTEKGYSPRIGILENPKLTNITKGANTINGVHVPYRTNFGELPLLDVVKGIQPSIADVREYAPGMLTTVVEWEQCGVQWHHIVVGVDIDDNTVWMDASGSVVVDRGERALADDMLLYDGDVTYDELLSAVTHFSGWNNEFRASHRATLFRMFHTLTHQQEKLAA